MVTFYQFSWGIDAAGPALTALQDVAVAQAADPTYDCRLGVGTAGRTATEIQTNAKVTAIGQYYGSAESLRAILDPVLLVGTPAEREANRASIREVTPAEAAELLSHTTPSEHFASKSAVLGRPLTTEQIERVVTGLLSWPGSRNPDGAGIALFGLGGRANEVPSDATAFVHRDALFIFAAEATWADNDSPADGTANADWLEQFYDAVFAAERPDRAYQNFHDPDLVDWREAYYGGNYERLVTVKRTYDPTAFFSYPQAIGRCP
jgi:hypothetical protein